MQFSDILMTAARERGGAAAASYSAEATAYFAAMSSQPDDTRKGLIDTLIGGLKTDGIWTKLDWLLLIAAHDSQAARVNAITPSKVASVVNSPTFTTDRGYAGDGATSYIDFGEAYNAGGNQFSQDSACAGVWINTSAATALVSQMGQVATSTGRVLIRARNSSGNETFELNNAGGDTSQANPGTRAGHRAASRTGSAVLRSFFNGTRVADLTTASTEASTGTICVLRSTASYTADRAAAAYCGSGLTDTEMGNIHTRLNTFLTAIGAN